MNDVNTMDGIRIAAVYSGLSYQHGVFFGDKYREKLTIIPVCSFPETDLAPYDALIFPRGTDLEIVYPARQKIADFLHLGRIVISFGEVTSEWLPGCRWDGVKPEDDGPLEIRSYHPIFTRLKAEDLHWHKGATGWCCHGHFIAPAEAEILATNLLGDPVMYIDRNSTNGIILAASQLDAVCHLFHGIRGADILFENMLNWVLEETYRIREAKEHD